MHRNEHLLLGLHFCKELTLPEHQLAFWASIELMQEKLPTKNDAALIKDSRILNFHIQQDFSFSTGPKIYFNVSPSMTVNPVTSKELEEDIMDIDF